MESVCTGSLRTSRQSTEEQRLRDCSHQSCDTLASDVLIWQGKQIRLGQFGMRELLLVNYRLRGTSPV